jgi:hypothetical protein
VIRLGGGNTQNPIVLRKFDEREVGDEVGELLDLAARNSHDAIYGDAIFEANMVLGKVALRRGDKRAAVRHLLAAADGPGSDRIRRGEFEKNLPRALVDWGERRAVADFP